jgi:UDP-GlcNAc:undecaprenyl-phosphate GlcNAc-1-phosphate transferase
VEAPTPAIYLALFLVSLSLSSLLVPLLRKIAFRYSILDRPNQAHKTHQETVPYLGGLAITFPIALLAISSPLIFTTGSDFVYRILLFLVPAFVLALVGLVDDLRNVSAKFRFLAQTLISTVIAVSLSSLGYSVSITSSEIANLSISIFWLVGITNAFNFFDNLDGGAAGITVISSFTLFLLALLGNQFLIASLALALVGGGLGFLYWNRTPAKIYLGDSGALFIGFLLAVSLLQFEPKAELRFVSAIVPLFVLALPIIDTTVAVISRLYRGVSIFQGGRDHLSHRLISMGLSRRKSAFSLWGMQIIFSTLSVIVSVVPKHSGLGISLLGFLFMGFLTIWFLRIRV